jgi:hypothetical protein
VIWLYTDETMRVVYRASGDAWESILVDELSEDERAAVPLFVHDHAKLVDQAKDEIRVVRQPVLSVLDGLQASYITKSDIGTATVIEVAKQALRDLTKIDLSACETLAAMKLVVLARYAQIASASPALKTAFSEATK